jgi:hypothetical protein
MFPSTTPFIARVVGPCRQPIELPSLVMACLGTIGLPRYAPADIWKSYLNALRHFRPVGPMSVSESKINRIP